MRALPVLVVALLLSSAVGAAGGLAGTAPVDTDERSPPSPAALDAPVVAQTDDNRTPLQQINVLDVPPSRSVAPPSPNTTWTSALRWGSRRTRRPTSSGRWR
ncbi:hypothetical protein ACFQL0_04890 [Haloplanus litoreus]|uniref:hypothetical protein n=1 Tax=Haloplanus litoreus TaxID=767515 RepID=UPI00361727A6